MNFFFFRWQKFVSQMSRGKAKQQPLYAHMCHRWNRKLAAGTDDGERMVSIESWRLSENSPAPGQPQPAVQIIKLPIFNCDGAKNEWAS